MDNEKELKNLGLTSSFSIYIPATLLMYLLTNYLIPYLSETTGQETILFWFIVAGLGVFTPLIIAGVMILKFEGLKFSKNIWTERLRFRKLTSRDLIWSIGGLLLVGVLSGIIMYIVMSPIS